MRNRKLPFFALCMMLLGGAIIHPVSHADSGSSIQALFINVRKADAILLMLNEQRILVDTGHKDSYDALEKALASYQVDHLDAVFITHTDKDHVGGLNKLLKSDVQVDQLYASALKTW